MKIQPLIVSVLGILVLLVGSTVYWCSSGYGEVSGDAYEVAKALYGTCLAQSDDRLESVSSLLDEDAERQLDLTDRERRWLESMIRKAENGDWKSAALAARQMMEEQVDY